MVILAARIKAFRKEPTQSAAIKFFNEAQVNILAELREGLDAVQTVKPWRTT